MWSHTTLDKLESTLSEIAFTKVTAFLVKSPLRVFSLHSYVKHWPLPTTVVPQNPLWSLFVRNLNLHFFTIFNSFSSWLLFWDRKKLKNTFSLYMYCRLKMCKFVRNWPPPLLIVVWPNPLDINLNNHTSSSLFEQASKQFTACTLANYLSSFDIKDRRLLKLWAHVKR